MFCVYLSQVTNKSLFTTDAAVVLWCDIISQILSTGNLIRFIWIIVLALQVQQEVFALGLGSHLS